MGPNRLKAGVASSSAWKARALGEALLVGLPAYADGAAYADAVSGYGALGRNELRETARAVISGRG